MPATTPTARALVLLAAALVLAACGPAPNTDLAAEMPPGADSVATAADDSPAATAVGGPTFDAPCVSTQENVGETTARSADVPPRTHAFATREDIRACVMFRTRDAGGRRSSVFSNYRPNVRFVGTDREATATHVCTLRFDADGAVEPGSTVAAYLRCEAPVEIEDGGAFLLVEGGREVGGGTIVLPPA
ncbi:hypothetical protein [Luteimonas terrae]|uniref:Translation elongation factor EFTu/EF1A C-terminal domain-containing protein n=1 Tax=Luteimonas terrae TaxID=1530191 RepID=A0ABU1XVW3_9GAMM|nr:hypothetical protein [Luteimonas terrae]MDR7192909.1 hypothetical protein [Luteimonas terrae]